MHFSWFHLIPALKQYPDHVLTLALVTVLIMGLSLLAKAVAGNPQEALIPDGNFSLRGLFEVIVESLSGLADSVLGHEAPIYLPIIGSFFLYILINNVFGLIPGFNPATDNLNTTIGIAIVSFFLYNAAGVHAHGFAYVKHFLGPVVWLAPLLVVIEVISHIARLASLSLRLYGNMMGDHTVLSIFLGINPFPIPMIFYGLGLFVCFVQAFVFTLLSMVYLSMATAHDH